MLSQNFKFILRIIFPRHLLVVFSCALIRGDLQKVWRLKPNWIQNNSPCNPCCSQHLHTCEPVSPPPFQTEEQKTVSALPPENTVETHASNQMPKTPACRCRDCRTPAQFCKQRPRTAKGQVVLCWSDQAWGLVHFLAILVLAFKEGGVLNQRCWRWYDCCITLGNGKRHLPPHEPPPPQLALGWQVGWCEGPRRETHLRRVQGSIGRGWDVRQWLPASQAVRSLPSGQVYRQGWCHWGQVSERWKGAVASKNSPLLHSLLASNNSLSP